MDEDVVRALAKWPDVPACHGWLALDRRGRWRMRDERAQHHGLQGDIVRNAALKAFIDRNYACTPAGEWYFQNGPQRVYVELEATPYVLLLDPGPARILTHTGRALDEIRTAYADETGSFYLGFADARDGAGHECAGLVCDRDLPALLERLRTADGRQPDAQETLDLLAEAPFALALDLPQAAAPLRLHSVLAADLPGRFGYVRRPAAPAAAQ